MATLYNPLDKENLGESVRNALLKMPVLPMPPDNFSGVGIYAIYYTGPFRAYESIAGQNKDGQFNCPIYVGKAVPKGSREGGLVKNPQNSTALCSRLRYHADSIRAATNLEAGDFFFRTLLLDDIWIPLGETYMIERFQPVWNKKVTGFGIKTPGERRKNQYTSLWDTIHPGRAFVTKLGLPPNPKSADQILRDVEAYLAMPQEEKAKIPVREEGEELENGE